MAKVLIIDDDQFIRMEFARVLGAAGYEIAFAVDAVSAISTATSERPDLIVLDMGLPAGSGMVVMERLRNLATTMVTPVIVVTGNLIDFDREQALRGMGCKTILPKSLQAHDLVAAVKAELAGPVAPVEG